MSELYSPDAEREVIAAVAFHGRAALGALPTTLRSGAAFSAPHRAPFRVLLAVAERGGPAHPAAVREAALAIGEAAIAEAPETVADAMDAIGSLDALPHFAGIVADLAHRRAVRDAGTALARHAGDRGLPLDAVVREHVAGVASGFASAPADASTLVDTLMDLEAEAKLGGLLPGVATSIPSLDNLLDGLCPERLIVLAARPGCGKTAFGLWCAHEAATAGTETYFVTLEQPIKQIRKRWLSLASGVDIRGALRQGRWDQVVGRVSRAAEEVRHVPLTFDDRANTATGIALAVQRHTALHQAPKLLIVDYLSWIQYEGRFDRNDLAIGSVTKALARLAKEAHCAVLLLVQISRAAVAEGKMRRPTLSDLRDSGMIEQDADQVVMLWEPLVEGVPRGDNDHAVMEFVVAKNRHGPMGLVDVEWLKPLYRYREAPRLARVA